MVIVPRASLVLACLLAGLGGAAAQTAGAASITAPVTATLTLTVDDAVRLARDHTPELAGERYDPLIGDTRVAQARGAFAPTFNSSVQRNSQLAPPTSFLVGNQGVSTRAFSSLLGVSQRVPWGGATYSLVWDSSRTVTDSFFTNFNPSLASRVSVTLSQPLLRDLAIDAQRFQLDQNRRNRDVAQTRLDESLARAEAEARRAYWGLVSSRAAVEVADQSLALARQLEANNRARVEVGQLPPLDLVAARAEVAQREEALLVARTQERQAEDRLRVLVLDAGSPDFWTTRIETADRVPAGVALVDVDGAIAAALRDRADLRRSRLERANAETAARFFGNQRLPDLRLQATYLANGIGGSRLIRSGGFPGVVVGTEDTSFGSVLNQLGGLDFPTWTVGLTLSYPIGTSADDASHARAELEARQSEARLRALEIRVAQQLREAAWNVDANRQRIDTSRAARGLAEQRLDAEQKRFEVGLSTSFLVVQAQRDLAQARTNELQARLAYERSVIDFDALQRAAPQPGAAAPAVTR
jgi:outer membrane protein TolC